VNRQGRREAVLPFVFLPGRSSQGICMTISAPDGSAGGDRLQSIALYRDLTNALRERVTRLLALSAMGTDGADSTSAVKEDCRVLQSVIEIEANLDKQRQAFVDGAPVELDLVAARAEILARLALRLAEG
jgi:hypothetical protein